MRKWAKQYGDLALPFLRTGDLFFAILYHHLFMNGILEEELQVKNALKTTWDRNCCLFTYDNWVLVVFMVRMFTKACSFSLNLFSQAP
jgi:hypothetical protein